MNANVQYPDSTLTNHLLKKEIPTLSYWMSQPYSDKLPTANISYDSMEEARGQRKKQFTICDKK
jgi:hypothetical protein